MTDGGGEGVDLGIPGLGPAVLVGRGGFGLVYRATQLSSGGVVAVKVVQGHLDRTASIRFERERAALGSLRGHPNICTVYDAGVDATGRPYLVMELATSSLADRITSKGPLPWEEVTSLGIRLAGALETAHRLGLLHRDVKPENVLVTSFGDWRLGDFGLARLTDDTMTGDITATLSHAAPELLEGAQASVASDVYALGSTMFVAFTGNAAFTLQPGAHQASVYKRIAEEPVPDMEGTPEAVAEVVRKAMAKTPGDRFATAAEMGTALQEAQQKIGVAVTPLPLPAGDTVPERAPEPHPELTVDGRTPVALGDLTEAVHRSGRERRPQELPIAYDLAGWEDDRCVALLDALSADTIPYLLEGNELMISPIDEKRVDEIVAALRSGPTGTKQNRRLIGAAIAVAAVIALVVAAIVLRGGDGSGGSATTTDPSIITDEVALPSDWRTSDQTREECTGAYGPPCLDTTDFTFDMTIGCGPVHTGGSGRSAGQVAEPECEVSFLGMEPVPLEWNGLHGGAQVEREDPLPQPAMEPKDECVGQHAYYSMEFWPKSEEVRAGRRVVTEVTGKLYAYFLTIPGSGIGSCGTSYTYSFVMQVDE